ncbi:MAG: tetratricopeptide (TPR) repeat protein [Psychromonas sp.]|jgi:tetratricopeptide (TPR) repeat protein|uniref:cytochrome c3 family protein n=1 Tax=Psychromonas sp. TaxID=1884585 RepID=UPI0039E3EA83
MKTGQIIIFLLTLLFISTVTQASISMSNCTACHQPQTEKWLQSDHAKAMLPPSSDSIVADLNQHYSDAQGNQFSLIKDKQDYLAVITEQGKKQIFKVENTFGHYPLQQYLVNIGNGRLQVLPYSWDARPKNKGGQRWFQVYSDLISELDSQSRYHWKQPLQNWNGMCADCHSSELTRNFSSEKNKFKSTWQEINVGCLSCHAEHQASIEASPKIVGNWQRKAGQKVAQWIGPARHIDTMDTCFSCHSLREPLTDGFSAAGSYLDKHMPNLLEQPFYYPDGQIKDEVYVYGSFQQSKMAQAGVTCLDCHDKHSMKVKAKGDALCLTCHAPEAYFTKDHHQHSIENTALQCVDCHMPETTYMGVDARRDHSFSVPNATLSHQYDSPDTCLSCHKDKDAQWSINAYKTLFGEVAPRSQTAHWYALFRAGKLADINKLWQVVDDKALPAIKRASAFSIFPQLTRQLKGDKLALHLTSSEDLLRLAATRLAPLLSQQDKVKYIAPRLSDKRKAIRVEAAKQSLLTSLPQTAQSDFRAAFNELLGVQALSTWRAEGLLNQAEVVITNNDVQQAIKLVQQAIDRDPYFDGSYINLAELYRALGDTAKENDVYLLAKEKRINSAQFNFSLGLFYIRNSNVNDALTHFSVAVKKQPENSQYLYIYLLGLKKAGLTQAFNQHLQQAIKRFPNHAEFKQIR